MHEWYSLFQHGEILFEANQRCGLSILGRNMFATQSMKIVVGLLPRDLRRVICLWISCQRTLREDLEKKKAEDLKKAIRALFLHRKD